MVVKMSGIISTYDILMSQQLDLTHMEGATVAVKLKRKFNNLYESFLSFYHICFISHEPQRTRTTAKNMFLL